jgi:hypothetical protein
MARQAREGSLSGGRTATKCPYCGALCDAEFVDIGVGEQQVSPHHCHSCGATEIGPFDRPERPLTDEEKRTGFYEPTDRAEAPAP